MEKVELNISSDASFYMKFLLNLFKRLKKGKLDLRLPDGSCYSIGSGEGVEADIEILDDRFFKRVFFSGDIGFGESYMEGEWKSSDVTNLMKWFVDNIENVEGASGGKKSSFLFNTLSLVNKVKHKFNDNTKTKGAENIKYHYDLSNEFFSLMLDKSMTYSCAIFHSEEDSLYDGQMNKYKSLADSLKLSKDDTVLEVGSGWGGNAIFMAKNYGCKVRSITISNEQLIYAKEAAKREGVEDLVTFEFLDYRDLDGQYDKIVSIEMIEAVGDKFLDEYFAKLASCLKPDGLLSIQAITSPDSRYDQFKQSVDWIQKHIFPGSLLPSVGRMNQATLKTSELHLVGLKDIGLDYAKTLRLWRENFFKGIDQVRAQGFDDIFIRKWEYYLCYCEAAFQMRNISDVQVTYSRPNNTRN